MIYLDNAATTFPKPPEVLRKMLEDYSRLGVSPGRGSYDLSSQCARYVHEVRQRLAAFFGAEDPNRVVFANNATDALNTIILGLVKPGCSVVSTRLEHNSVLRPLHHLRDKGLIDFSLVRFDGQGFVDPRDIAGAVTGRTAFVIVNHVSNVLGTIQPVGEIGRLCAERGVPLVLDVSQSAGLVPIDMREMNVAAVAFTGHKSLLGPSGIGGLVTAECLDIKATRFGGTGYESWSPVQPDELPYRLESGTLNVLGIMGLSAGLRYISDRGMAAIFGHETSLAARLLDGLATIDKVTLHYAASRENHVPILTFNVKDMDPEDVAAILDGDFDIAVRSGLHCAPLVHEDIGTGRRGSVRFSIGPLNTKEDIDAATAAVRAVAGV